MPRSRALNEAKQKPSERDPEWRRKCYAQRYKTVAQRIEEKAVRDPETGCLNWIGAADGEGYGLITTARRLIRVTRYLLANKIGRALSDGELACHSCDNPACIEEDHLWLGSDSDNQIDSVIKGRRAAQRLMPSDVALIRSLWARGGSQAEICRQFKISEGHVNHIVHRKKWRHVSDTAAEREVYAKACSEKRPRNRGEAHGLAKLTEQSVRFIKQSNLPGVELAKRLGVHPSSICDIRKGRRWKWVEA